MKKILLFFLSLTFAVGALSGCDFMPAKENSSVSSSFQESTEGSSDGDSSSEAKKEFFTVTFKQDGQDDIVKQVEEGKGLTDVPTPVQKTGYTTNWSAVDFSAITEDMTVTAVATPNNYTITYDAGEGKATPETQQVTYDTAPGSFATAVREGYNFQCWTYEAKAVQATDIWKIASDVTLVASWVEIEKRTVTFVQAGYEPIVVEVLDGGTLTGEMIPETQPKKGYTVVWEEKIVPSITENIVINAVATPNTYTITYDAGEGTVATAEQKVTYDSAPGSFATPTRDGYKFKGWEYEGVLISATELWAIDDNVTLTARWAKIYTITLNANGGELAQTTIEVVEGEAYSLPVPTRTEYEFRGWKYGSTKVESEGIWTLDAEEITLQASWQEKNWTKDY